MACAAKPGYLVHLLLRSQTVKNKCGFCYDFKKSTRLTRDAVLALALHLQRLHVDALVADEASAGDAPVRLTEAFVT